MATNDDLDNFFKKKDRKSNKHNKQTDLLTNNEELFKKLVTVTSATSIFKENMDFNDEDDDEEQYRNNEITSGTGSIGDNLKNSNEINKTKPTTKHFHEQQINTFDKDEKQQQDEWEEFIDSSYKYDSLRLKFPVDNNDDDDGFYNDDENNPDNNKNNNDDKTGSNEQQKEKPVWKIDQVKETTTIPIVEENKTISTSQPKSTGVYRPPQLRSETSITVVSGTNQRISKKKEPNLASTDEFPTLKSAVNKK